METTNNNNFIRCISAIVRLLIADETHSLYLDLVNRSVKVLCQPYYTQVIKLDDLDLD